MTDSIYRWSRLPEIPLFYLENRWQTLARPCPFRSFSLWLPWLCLVAPPGIQHIACCKFHHFFRWCPSIHGWWRDLIAIWLVVGPPLWKIWKSIGMIIPNIWENKIDVNQTTNQPCSRPPEGKTLKIRQFSGSARLVLHHLRALCLCTWGLIRSGCMVEQIFVR